MLACVGLELVAVFWLVKNIFSAVCAFLLVTLCATDGMACVAVGKQGSNLVRCPAVARNERIHAFKHHVICLFIGCRHQLKLCLMLLLEEGEHHHHGLAFFLCCC
jgi:hypothetical protein